MTKLLGTFGALVIVLASACGDGGNDSDNQCGDGVLGGNEQCDDGNTAGGDGCSSTCTTEQASTCGDGTIDVNNGEQCDDGNTANGDGCSSSCLNESPSNCGNNHIDTGETCDDGNTVSGDGCSSFCQLEEGGTSGSCTAPLDIALVTGTNGTATATITGNTMNGMDHFPAADCGTVIGRGDGFDLQYKLVVAEKSNVVIRAAASTAPDLILRLSTAACDAATTVTNGCSDEPETLNLNNLAAGTYYLDVDGYDNTEYGAFSISVSVKPSLCGNGTVDPGEGCDDSNNVSGDGCSATCHDETAGGCANPQELAFDDTDSDGNPLATVMGDTSTGTNEFAAGTCGTDMDVGGGKDVTYSFTLTETSDVRTDLISSISWGGIIRLTTAGCDINTEVVLDPDTGSGCSESPYNYNYWSGLPAGTYYITMDGKTPTSQGTFNLRVRTITPTLCGNGDPDDDGEDCDDGNTDDNDGCSSRCLVEDGFVCDFEAPTTCMIDVCGNGMIDNGEQCDDTNRTNGDGCSKTCQLESGFTCTGSPSVCALKCGNGMIDSGETCDDADRDSGDGCSSTCQLEAGYTCSGSPSVCMTRCGNSQIDTGETCDDGDADAGDGCSATCQIESGFICSGLPSVCTRKCGNGIIESGETCDDGDADSGDGCSATCQKEPGYTCVGLPSMCTTKCGNNVIDPGETCDDGNAMAGDGCSNICKVEDQYTCTGLPSVCTPTPAVCGDGAVQVGETCDDKNTTAGDGCSATCVLENLVSEMEPNDSTPQALTAGNHIIKGSFSTTSDVDLYTFTLTAPATMTAETFTGFDGTHTYSGLAGGNTNLDCTTPSMDTKLALYNGTTATGTDIDDDDDSGDGVCSLYLSSTPLAAGTYTLKVSEYSFAPAATYYVDLRFQ
ncbi:MAG TPA: DVUA0089 family protein [Kofleriaceae bacterium]|jgi:cysteine-rich repeat protein